MAKELKPFHETVVALIRHCPLGGLITLRRLIEETKIPANHDEIIKAIKARCLGRCDGFGRMMFEKTLASVLEQKREAEEKEESQRMLRAIQDMSDQGGQGIH